MEVNSYYGWNEHSKHTTLEGALEEATNLRTFWEKHNIPYKDNNEIRIWRKEEVIVKNRL